MPHPAETITGVRLAPAGTRSNRVPTLRDVVDVEAYVIGTLHEAALTPTDGELAELVASGIESVYRLERALPPDQPLLPVLEKVLSKRLVELWSYVRADRDVRSDQSTAIAA